MEKKRRKKNPNQQRNGVKCGHVTSLQDQNKEEEGCEVTFKIFYRTEEISEPV